jgi:hypothetical protein
LRVIGAVDAVETPVSDSAHPWTELQVPVRPYPEPAVNVVVAPSVRAMTTELNPGVNEVTDAVVEPAEELPVDVFMPVVEYPFSS